MKVQISLSAKSLTHIKDVVFDAILDEYNNLNKDAFEPLYEAGGELGVDVRSFEDFWSRYEEDQRIGKADFQADQMRDAKFGL